MKTKLKHIFFLASLSFAATACGGSGARPLSGLDVSLLPVNLLTISPNPAYDEDAESGTIKMDTETKDNVATASARIAKRSSPRALPVNHQPSMSANAPSRLGVTISNQQ